MTLPLRGSLKQCFLFLKLSKISGMPLKPEKESR
jgi:hypothetical protein